MATKTRQARKQRTRLFTLSLHQRRKAIVASLSKELRARFKRRSIALRKGDKVKVMCGDFKGVTGEVMRVDVAEKEIFIDKVTVKKRDGTDVLRAMKASNVVVTDIDIRDKNRQKILARKVGEKVVEEEAKKEDARMKKAEEERKAKEAEMKAKEAEEKAKKEQKAEEKAAEGGKEKEEIKVSEKGIDEKTKKDWIAQK